MEHPRLEANLTIAEVLSHWPQTIPIFFHHRMACVGCVMAPFETLTEVSLVYRLDLDGFLRELQQAIEVKRRFS
jgi:hybrid cluster-associated redox disulfide protein